MPSSLCPQKLNVKQPWHRMTGAQAAHLPRSAIRLHLQARHSADRRLAVGGLRVASPALWSPCCIAARGTERQGLLPVDHSVMPKACIQHWANSR